MSVMVWGHRGHRHHRAQNNPELSGTQAHENSLAAYKETLQRTMGVECDVVQSRLKTPYLLHDTLFNGMVKYEFRNQLDQAGQDLVQDRFIFDINDGEIEAMRLKDGQPIPSLKNLLEIMPHYPGRFINLELKGPNVVDITVRSVERAIYREHIGLEQVIFSSFNLPALHSLRLNNGSRFAIGISFMVTDQPLAQMYPNWPLAEQNAYYVPFSIDALQRPDIIDICPDYFNLEVRSLSVESIEAIHHFFPKTKIILWSAGEPYPSGDSPLLAAIETYAPSRKIFAVITDYPLATQAALEARGVKLRKPL